MFRRLVSVCIFSVAVVAMAFVVAPNDKPGFDEDGLPHGTFTETRPDGSVACITTFSHGSWVSKTVFDADGRKLETITQ